MHECCLAGLAVLMSAAGIGYGSPVSVIRVSGASVVWILEALR